MSVANECGMKARWSLLRRARRASVASPGGSLKDGKLACRAGAARMRGAATPVERSSTPEPGLPGEAAPRSGVGGPAEGGGLAPTDLGDG